MKIPLPKNFNPPAPLKVYDYQDVTVTLFTSKMKLNQWTNEIWLQKQIVPQDWQVKKTVKDKGRSLNFVFSSGLQITIFSRRIILILKGEYDQVNLTQVIKNLIFYLPNYDYKRLQFIFRRVITFPSVKYQASQFLKEKILKGNDEKWSIAGVEPVKSQVNFCISNTSFASPLIINISDLPVNNRKIKAKSCLLFRGIFNYKVNHNSNNSNSLPATIDDYEKIKSKFNKVIEQKFLNK